MDESQLYGRKAIFEEAMDSGEFFLSGLRLRISQLQTKRDILRSQLTSLESEERALKVQQNKITGVLLSQEMRNRNELESLKAEFQTSEELLWASRLEKEDKCKKLEIEIESMRRKRGLVHRLSNS